MAARSFVRHRNFHEMRTPRGGRRYQFSVANLLRRLEVV